MTTRRNFLFRGVATLAALPVLVTTARAQTTHTVTIKNMSFTPENLTISAGDTVTWVNEDRPRHSAWDDSGDTFDTGLLANGDSASVTFNAAGSFNYRCRPHSNMRGTITVS
ncbi:Plastocyanin [Octadecabacter temperatus]|uniref:Amicyanin n=1 Tax=Octadecabacter temperatus TaxID=1458307 RepID=A0A0K0Y5K8_9RHOB|nr:cupredoxin family copper-binding protein [Octadecabacter temperatus]AKS46249.1 Amicyanin precursor [Octadecabacter temperatus]SIO10517.1 Plastocyanin [Octadecabacter temperatus]